MRILLSRRLIASWRRFRQLVVLCVGVYINIVNKCAAYGCRSGYMKKDVGEAMTLLRKVLLYKDHVSIYPMAKLTAAKQLECFNHVMTLLRNVVVISVDNASTNRKFLTDCLCDGQLKTHITDPLIGQHIFLMFDPVHHLKTSTTTASPNCSTAHQRLLTSGVTSHWQPRQCRGAQGPKTVKGAQNDPNYVSRLSLTSLTFTTWNLQCL